MSKDSREEKIRNAIAAKTDQGDLIRLMANAKAEGRRDVHELAFLRLCALWKQEAHDPLDPIAERLEAAVRASEFLLGKRAGRTRLMIARRGSVGTIKHWLTYDKPSDGYAALVAAGYWDLLGEAIPLEFPDRFGSAELEVARYRISDAKEGRISDPFLPSWQRSLLP